MMFGFNQFFSAFGFQQPNIDPILERAESIDDILDEDNIITIVKSQTGMQKFGDQLQINLLFNIISIRKHPDMIKKLVKYIIEEPELHEQMDSKRCFKYPFISSELFSCEIPLLINSLFEDLRTMSPTKQEDEEEDKGNEFMGLSRAKPSGRMSGKMNGEDEEIVEQIDINCEEEEQNNEFLEKDKEKGQKDVNAENQADGVNQVNEAKEVNEVKEQETEVKEEKNLKEDEEKAENLDEQKKEQEKNEEKEEKETKNGQTEDYDISQVDKYVDETIKHVVQKLTNVVPKKTNTVEIVHEVFKSCDSSINEEKPKIIDPIVQIEPFDMLGIQLMEYLLSFIKCKSELNETSAGYWAKVITAIVNKRGTDFMDYLAENANESFNCLINFIGCRSVADIVLKLVLLEVPSLEAKKILYYVFYLIVSNELNQQQRTQLVSKLYEKLTTSNNTYELENISYVLSEIFNKYPNQYNGSQELIEFILTESNLNILFKNIINQKDSTLYIYSLKIIESIFKFFNQSEEPQNNINTFMGGSAEKTENKDDEIKQNLAQLLIDSKLQQCFLNFLLELILKLTEEQQLDEVNLQLKIKIKPFGLGKLKLLEILYLGLKNQLPNSTEALEEKLKTTHFFNILLNFVKAYEWNNFVHTQIEKILLLVLQTSCGIRQLLFSSEFNLLQIIMDGLSQLHFFLTPERPYRTTHGNLMIYIKLGNEIMQQKTKENGYIAGVIENDTKWQKFYDDVFTKLNKDMTLDLGGVNPREKKVTANDNEREIDLANIFKKFSAFFSNSSLGGSLNNNQTNENDEESKIKKEEEEDDGDYNQLGKKYLEQDVDDEFERGDENNQDQNEENNAQEPKEKMSLQKLKLQQLTAGGAPNTTNHVSKAKNDRNVAYAAYAAYGLKQKSNQDNEEEEDESQNIQQQFNKNIQLLFRLVILLLRQFKEKQQQLLKDIKQPAADLDDDDEFAKDQLQEEIQNQLDHILEPQFYSNQYWDVTDYKSADISEEISELL